jgi:O-6-methylguanine DNA methyltransferase
MKVIPATILTKMKTYSAFDQKVWTACAQIPAGETRTYQWIARKIGSPRSSRAVGSALGRNPFAPTIPCHRVVRSDGKMGGYSGRGGIQTKIKLLQKEGAKII